MPEYASVRVATPADQEGLMEIGRLLHAENAMLQMDEDLVRELVWSFTTHTPTTRFAEPGLIAVIGEEGKPLEGMICLRVTQLWYSRQPLIEELWNFVHPDHRRSNHAKSLIFYAKALADDLGLPLLIGIVSNIQTAQKIRLYERLLPMAGAYFIHRGDLPPAERDKQLTSSIENLSGYRKPKKAA